MIKLEDLRPLRPPGGLNKNKIIRPDQTKKTKQLATTAAGPNKQKKMLHNGPDARTRDQTKK